MRRSIKLGVPFFLVYLATAGCATRQPIEGRKAGELDRKLSAHAWIEEGKLATLIVGTLPTRDKDGKPYIPFQIAVANNGLRQLVLTRESFTLIDADKNRYPVAGPRELIEGYDQLDFDRYVGELQGIVVNKFGAYAQYASNFTPTENAHNLEVVRDLVSLPKFGYLIDYIYFPAPPGGVLGQRFELFMDSPNLDEPVFVKFEVR